MAIKDILKSIKGIATAVVELENVKPEEIKEDVKASEEIKEEVKEEIKEDVKFAQEKLDNGAMVEAESFEAGQPVFVVAEGEERVPLPVGEYEWQGKVLVVAEEGMIGEIKEAAAEEGEATLEGDFVTKEAFNKLVETVNKLTTSMSSHKDILEQEKKDLLVANAALQKEVDNKPDAEKIKPQGTKKKVTKKASTKLGRIYQTLNK